MPLYRKCMKREDLSSIPRTHMKARYGDAVAIRALEVRSFARGMLKHSSWCGESGASPGHGGQPDLLSKLQGSRRSCLNNMWREPGITPVSWQRHGRLHT